MKRLHVLAVLCLGFFLPFILAGFPSVVINGEQSIGGAVNIPSMVKKTTADLNLYVRTTGDDSHDCLSAGAACLTIQEAVDRVPKQIEHAVSIDVGEGTFTGFALTNFNIHRVNGSITVTGKLGNATISGGTTFGTADGGDTFTCTDSGQAWDVNNLRGKMFLVDGEYRIVRDNTGQTANLIGPLSATCSGKAYSIVEQKTIVNGTSPIIHPGLDTTIFISNNIGYWRDSVINNIKVDGTSQTISIFLMSTSVPKLERLHSYGGYYSTFFEVARSRIQFNELYISDATNLGLGISYNQANMRDSAASRLFTYNNSGPGLYMFFSTNVNFLDYVYSDSNGESGLKYEGGPYLYVKNFYAKDNTSHGVDALTWGSSGTVEIGTFDITGNGGDGIRISGGVDWVDFNSGTIDGNGGYGIVVEPTDSNITGGTFVGMPGTFTIQNNTSGGILVRNRSTIALSNADGAGNGGYGLELEGFSYALITSDTGITGTSGDATINDGATTLTWATDFNDNGDIVVNLDNGCRIERRD